jgi:ElaB/YqjD/DUF883 family membrane-anchored ribosome-binding protein
MHCAVAAGGTIVLSEPLLPAFLLTGRDLMSSTEHSGPRASTAKSFESSVDDITARGAAALRDTKASFDAAVSDVAEKGQEALQGAREVRDTVADAILTSIKVRPYTTLAIAGLAGFLYGAMRRR